MITTKRRAITGHLAMSQIETAVPETRTSAASSQVARKEASGTVSLASRVATNRRPARQVVMIVKTTRPITNGNQPPLGIFIALPLLDSSLENRRQEEFNNRDA